VIARLTTRHLESSIGLGEADSTRRNRAPERQRRDHNAVSVVIGLHGSGDYEDLVAALTEVDGVLAVSATTPDEDSDPEVE
jgi:hypothetical protein